MTVFQAFRDNKWVADVAGTLTVDNCAQCVTLWEKIDMVPRNGNEPDKFSWTGALSGQYSARDTYNMLCQGSITCNMFEPVWKSSATPTVKLFCWLALRYRLWTSDRRHRHGLQDNPDACFTCLQAEDNVDHILMQCPYAREVWYKCLQRASLHLAEPQGGSNLKEWWTESRKRVAKPDRKKFDAMVALVARSLWKQHNARVFGEVRKQLSTERLVEAIEEEFKLWELASTMDARE
jgi:hypothetical protein